ncbi:GTP cyclohydrolase I FolE [Consotaella aegiceratis]|uniref:GTP cyclohydrolase I FolE n=1 Tax=Consotaella aegiceratis TaxID=3097961 RepID=UPI002F3FF395
MAAHGPIRPNREEAEVAVATLLRWIGEDPAREGLRATPARVIKSLEETFSGYRQDAAADLGRTFEKVAGYDGDVLVRGIHFFSHCEHHMLPIIGRAHVAYRPAGRVVGLSKIVRCVHVFARRLQTQEALTAQIGATLYETLRPRGVAVAIEAEHLCMAMRGIRQSGSVTQTRSFHGEFKDDPAAAARILSEMLRQHGGLAAQANSGSDAR